MPNDINVSSTRYTKNHILNSLPKDSLDRLLPHMVHVEMDSGKILYKSQETIGYVYFPLDSMVSVVAVAVSGQSAEVGVIGSEGMVGIDALMGADSALNDNMVQLPDGALRIKLSVIRDEFDRAGAFQKLSLTFMRMMLMQVSQTALCNRLHSAEKRLSRWLLMSRDRSPNDKLKLTQEFLSIMLGMSRVSVTTSAIELQERGFIRYSRGRVTIIDRVGLEAFVCDCYQTIQKEYQEFLKSGGQ